MKLPLPASPMAGVKQTLINNTRYSLTRMTDELVLCRFTMYSSVSLGFFRLMEIKLPVGRHQTSAVSELGQFLAHAWRQKLKNRSGISCNLHYGKSEDLLCSVLGDPINLL